METGELVKRLSLLEDQKNLILSLSEEYGHNLEEDKEETDINDDGIDFEEEEKKIKLNPVDIFNAEDMLVEKQSFTKSPITATFPVMSTNTTTPNLNNCNDNNPTFTFVPAPFPVQQLQFPQLQLQNTTNPPAKPKRKQVKNACVNCQRACKKCDEGRPCQRCIKYELTDTCQDSIRKERKKEQSSQPKNITPKISGYCRLYGQ
ncbi:1051_t:CDS:2, partial [Entrophospora sp. SA101]